MGLLSGLGASVATKVATGVAVAAVATGAAGAAAETAAAGSANPTDWRVNEHVQWCKDQLQDGQHGIGKCVSEFAKHHGQKKHQAAGKTQPKSGDAQHGKGAKAHKPAHPGKDAGEDPGVESPDAADGSNGTEGGKSHAKGHASQGRGPS